MGALKTHNRTTALFALLGLLLAGCGASVSSTVKVSEAQIAKYDTFSADDALAALEKRVNDAQRVNMPFFAPSYFREAATILSDINKSSKKAPKDKLIGDIARADAILDKGQSVMAIVQDRLSEELKLNGLLNKHDAARIFPKEYEKSVGALSDLVEKIELETAANIDKDRIKLSNSMHALLVDTVKFRALHEIEVINKDTKRKNGEKQAPVTFAEALSAYQDAENRIAKAPLDEKSVQLAADDALFAANHARQMNQRVAALQNLFKVSVETIARQEEDRLLGISTALMRKDLRDQTIEKQAEEIAVAAVEAAQSGKHADNKPESANVSTGPAQHTDKNAQTPLPTETDAQPVQIFVMKKPRQVRATDVKNDPAEEENQRSPEQTNTEAAK